MELNCETLRFGRKESSGNQRLQDLSVHYFHLFPSFQPITAYNCIIVHNQTSHQDLDIANDAAANATNFIIDTQHQVDTCQGSNRSIPALIQILIQSIEDIPVILLIEVSFLKSRISLRTRDMKKDEKIKQLFRHILSPNKCLVAWGNPKEKLAAFYKYNLFCEHDFSLVNLYDMHDHFKYFCRLAFPKSSVIKQSFESYTLQEAIFNIFGEILNNKMQYALWTTGIDLSLKTYYRGLLSIEKQDCSKFIANEINYRLDMKMYAILNCLAISKLMNFIISQCPLKNCKIKQM